MIPWPEHDEVVIALVELFERGMSLSDTCRKQLEEAETRVDMLIRREGKMTAEPFRVEKP